MNLTQLIDQAALRLTQAGVAFGHGTTNAQDEAAWLVLWQLGLPLDTDLDEVAEQPVTAEQQTACAALIEERIATRKASNGMLPVPAFRLSGTPKPTGAGWRFFGQTSRGGFSPGGN